MPDKLQSSITNKSENVPGSLGRFAYLLFYLFYYILHYLGFHITKTTYILTIICFVFQKMLEASELSKWRWKESSQTLTKDWTITDATEHTTELPKVTTGNIRYLTISNLCDFMFGQRLRSANTFKKVFVTTFFNLF